MRVCFFFLSVAAALLGVGVDQQGIMKKEKLSAAQMAQFQRATRLAEQDVNPTNIGQAITVSFESASDPEKAIGSVNQTFAGLPEELAAIAEEHTPEMKEIKETEFKIAKLLNEDAAKLRSWESPGGDLLPASQTAVRNKTATLALEAAGLSAVTDQLITNGIADAIEAAQDRLQGEPDQEVQALQASSARRFKDALEGEKKVLSRLQDAAPQLLERKESGSNLRGASSLVQEGEKADPRLQKLMNEAAALSEPAPWDKDAMGSGAATPSSFIEEEQTTPGKFFNEATFEAQGADAFRHVHDRIQKYGEEASQNTDKIMNWYEHAEAANHPSQSSFAEIGSPDSFADLDAKLKQLEEKTKAELAKLQADTAAPSSFAETGSPDSFADLDTKLKQLEEKTKAELAKLQADTAAPSSFAETGSPDSFADLDAKLKQLEEKTKAELAKLQADTAAPSSFAEVGSPDSFADLDAKLKQLEEKTKAELAKLQADTAAPSSFAETGSPDSFADLDAKLKQLEEKTKAELAKLQADTAAPSSFAEIVSHETLPWEDLDAKLKQVENNLVLDHKKLSEKDMVGVMHKERKMMGFDLMTHLAMSGAPPSSFLETGPPDYIYNLNKELGREVDNSPPHENLDMGKAMTQLDGEMEADLANDPKDTEKFTPLGLRQTTTKQSKETAEPAKLQAETAAPSSFAETGYPDSFLQGGVDSNTEAARLQRRKMLNQMERAYGLPESHSFLEENAAKLTALTQRLHEQQDEAAYEVPVQAGEDPLKTYASARQDLTLPG